MKTAVITIIATLGLAAAEYRPSGVEARDLCGDLGVMAVPEGVDPDSVRLCLEHPAGPIAERQADARACEPIYEPTGCDGGYCWKRCGADSNSGEWCWTAENGGHGDWITCSGPSDCLAAGDCGIGDCDSCGCSCD
jgi:hypothetical protein